MNKTNRLMGIEDFNSKIIAAQEKLFDAEVIITGCVFDILKNCEGSCAEIYAEVALLGRGGYTSLVVRRVFLDGEYDSITVSDGGGITAVWGDFDIAAKEIIMNELFQKYSADKYYEDLSTGEELH